MLTHILRDLFINFCVLVTIMVLGSVVVRGRPELPRGWGERLLYTAGGILTGLLLMQFPVRHADGVILAFHAVSPALSGLYGGPVWGLAVALPLALYRFSMGGAGGLPGGAHLLIAGLAAGFFTIGVRGFNRPHRQLVWRAFLIFAPANLTLLLVPVHGPDLFRGYFLPVTLAHAGAMLVSTWVLHHRFAHEQSLQQMTDLSLTDHLTRLPNLRAFEEALGQIQGGETGCFLLLDVDHFKLVNDRYGHLEGDRVLQKVGEILRQEVRESDLLCRYGGEEFAVYMRACAPHQAAEVAERIRAAIARGGVSTSQGEIRVTVSGGLISFDPGIDFRRQFESADRLLYRAKALGRNRIESELNAHLKRDRPSV
ncbi:MAG: diguanylate cyclase [Bacillota bacterium]